jgi:hypothetical protein
MAGFSGFVDFRRREGAVGLFEDFADDSTLLGVAFVGRESRGGLGCGGVCVRV